MKTRPGSAFIFAIVFFVGSSAFAAAPTTQPQVNYAVVVTGGELLAGVYPDAHTSFLARELRPRGLDCTLSMIVDDDPGEITRAMKFALEKASLVIVTGGLGPTDNDLTRETLSKFTSIPLKEHPDVLRDMERRFNTPAAQLRANLRRQTQVPTRGTYLRNPAGTAVGLVFEMPEAVIIALPGPPRELQAIVKGELLSYLERRYGAHRPGCSLVLRFVGIGQSQISQTMHEHALPPPDVILSSTFEGGRVDFGFALHEDTPENRQRLEQLRRQIKEHLGDWIYAEDQTSLESQVLKLLASRKASLALVECGSGGALAATLSDADGAAAVLAGSFQAPREQTLRKLLRTPDDQWNSARSSAQRAELLAAAGATVMHSDYLMAIGEPETGADGSRYVQVCLRLPSGQAQTQRIAVRGTGELARATLATQLLDILWRRLR